MKIRMDILLVEEGFFDSREKAKRAIMAGMVYINGQKAYKAGTKIDIEGSKIEVRGKRIKYVGRGGLKLEKAINFFNLNLEGKTAMDIGASTGGFTDCMLQNGVRKVYAVDVGYGQLDYKLRQDSRVSVMERTNIRYLKHEEIDSEIDFISIDVSFISLRLVLPVAYEMLKEDGEIVFLLKPQFEAGREKVGRNGVIRDGAVHSEVIIDMLRHIERYPLFFKGITYSPIKGAKGNIEFLIHCTKSGEEEAEKCDYALLAAELLQTINFEEANS
ncbi:MAG: TlyA family RNA methyltransferase [Peptostreptococcaceae bacterium]|nr:TlyA family RNA methyltransferase [Peptostreptococcaceae bacterium]